MSLYEYIISKYPELENKQEIFLNEIILQNEGNGDYIKKWDIELPIPFELNKIFNI